MAPILASLAEKYQGKLEFVKVNTDLFPEEAQSYSIKSLPTVMFFKGGDKVGSFSGYHDADKVETHIKNYL